MSMYQLTNLREPRHSAFNHFFLLLRSGLSRNRITSLRYSTHALAAFDGARQTWWCGSPAGRRQLHPGLREDISRMSLDLKSSRCKIMSRRSRISYADQCLTGRNCSQLMSVAVQTRSAGPAFPAWSTPLCQQHKAAKPMRPCLRHRPLRSTRSGT